ncbi:transcriptional regulator [Sulfolobales archaeon HS-7]|nr:transcriptional regulator [Sulfolobales archaeon HS-7]
MMKSSAIDDIIDKVSKMATPFGISKSELKTYSTLLLYGTLTAREIASKLGISYTKVYPILTKLESRGWIHKIHGKPVKYEAYPLRDVWIKIKKNIEERMELLEKQFIEPLSAVLATPSPFYSVFVISGEQVKTEMIRLLSEAKGKVMIAISNRELLSKELRSIIESLIFKADVRVLACDGLEIKGADYRNLSSMFGSGVITNQGVLLIVKSGETQIGLLSNHQYFVEIASVYFEYLWNQAKTPGTNT